MKIKFRFSCFDKIPTSVYGGLHGFSAETKIEELEVGKQFVVYGINTIKRHLWYLIQDNQMIYPMYYPSALFEIIDGRLSSFWIARENLDDYDDNVKAIDIGIREIVENKYFYGELLEDNSEYKGIFDEYKKNIKNEFT
ncbi:MAG: hypothetical protein ABI378_02870 [Chitinophagaceae bacterium]